MPLESVPPGYKLLAWEGAGLFVPRRWDIGRHGGDHRHGLFRVDDESRVVIQARWWTAVRLIPFDEVVHQHARTLHGNQPGPPPPFKRIEGLGLPEGPDGRAGAFISAGELLVVWQRLSVGRVLMVRFLLEAERPGLDQIRVMLSGLRLQGLDSGRDWAALDFALRSPPGYVLDRAELKAGVCYLAFRNGRRRMAWRRFSAADAVTGAADPGLEDLERWCRLVYAGEFYDMRYQIERTLDPRGRPLLRLMGKRRLLAPIELKWLIPKHRRLPRRIDIIWDAAANKIYCLELLRPTPDLEPDVLTLEQSSRMTLGEDSPVEDQPPASAPVASGTSRQQMRFRSLNARVQRSPEVTFGPNDKGRTVIRYTVQRPGGLRILRLLGGLSAGPVRQERSLELDLIGSLVWEECGRDRRVSDVIETVRARFRISYREAELSVTEFIRMLGSRGIVSVVMERIAPAG